MSKEEKIYQQIQEKGLQWKLNEYDWSNDGAFGIMGNPTNHASSHCGEIKAILNFTKGKDFADFNSAKMEDYVKVKMFLDFSHRHVGNYDFIRAVERFRADNKQILQIWEAARINQVAANPTNLETIDQLQTKVGQLEQELATEREATQQALQTSQEWHERQKQEIIAQWQQKLTSLLTSRKSQLTQEIQLIKEALHV